MLAQRITNLIALTFALLLCWAFFVVASAAPSDPVAIACPSNQTVTLEGSSPPNEPLLTYLSGRAIGGGVANAAGTWRVPLRVRERPGQYRVEVRSRATNTLFATFTCFVDIPVEGGAIPTTTATVPQAPTQRPTFTASPTQPSFPTNTSTTVSTPTGTRTGGNPIDVSPTATSTSSGQTTTATPTPTTTGTPATATPTVTGTPPTVMPTLTQTPTPTTIDVFVEVFLDDPESVTVTNETTENLNLSGWSIQRKTGSAEWVNYKSFLTGTTLEANGGGLEVFTTTGTDEPTNGLYYAGFLTSQWKELDFAVLRNERNLIVTSCVVMEDGCKPCRLNASETICTIIDDDVDPSSGQRERFYAYLFNGYHWSGW